MSKPSFLSVLLTAPVLLGLLTFVPARAVPAPAGYARTCGEVPSAQEVTTPLPRGVTGRVDFFAARYDPATGAVTRAVRYGRPDALHPMASSFKPLLVHAVWADIDAGRFTPGTLVTSTPGTRSLGAFPAGRNTLAHLTDIAINGSNNTAADLLLLTYGPERLAREVHAVSPCTSVLVTTKGWWAAQAGLAPDVLGPDAVRGAARYGAMPFEARVGVAGALIRAGQRSSAQAVEAGIDRVFRSRTYSPAMELDLQNTTTPAAYTALVRDTLSGAGLSAASASAVRKIFGTGCCRPEHPRLRATYWGAKGGITWRVLNLTGYVELPDGTQLAYVFMNDLSDTADAGALRASVPGVLPWIETQLLRLSAP
ncbi:serine hydrolase [Deinococcus aquiradiocola]|nr:serine hydrolase [Deinococcus aquiradiocola]